jgi:hypothetical protein
LFAYFVSKAKLALCRSKSSSRPRRLRFETLEMRRVLAPLADIVDITPDPHPTAVGLVTINFTDSATSQPTIVNGVDITDFTLTRDGNSVSLAGLTVNGSGDSYTLDLTSVTGLDGAYSLTLVANGTIVDPAGAALTQAARDNFVVDTPLPSANIVDISPDPRSTAVGNVTIVFDEEVFGVDVNDFTLQRDQTIVPLGLLPVQGSGTTYTINLSTVTSASGTYLLTLKADSDIRDSVGNALVADATDTWTTDASSPTATVGPVTPDPRNTAVGNVAITFTENVSGVDINDFTLTRNGTTVSLAGLTVSGSGSNYTLNLSTVTTATGTYVLTLVASGSGITDGFGNPLSGNASDTWVNESTVPTADIVDVTPDPRSIPVGAVTINFSEAVTGVDINDLTLTRNGTKVDLTGLTVNGGGASYSIDLSSVTTTFGSYTLTLVASGSGITDLAGNAMTANASDSWIIDDVREQNDTLRTAQELGRISGVVTLDSLGLVDANDWYRFTISAKGTAKNKVTISFDKSQGNLDLQLYSVSGQKLRSSTGNGNTETVSLNGLKPGTYYIRVYGKGGAINPSYTMTINAPTNPAKPSASAVDALFASLSPTTTKKVVG